MTSSRRVAVLGAGIMGCTTSLFLARKAISTTLFDKAAEPFSGASRWNEGKIHLGYLYAADRQLETARRVIPGGLAFKDLVEQLIGPLPDRVVMQDDDIYLIHRDSVVAPDLAARYFAAVTDLVDAVPTANRYFGGKRLRKAEQLSRREVTALADDRLILAGFRVPERSVMTNWIADRFLAAVKGESRIETAMRQRVMNLRAAERGDRWLVDTDQGTAGPFDFVVNALWEGRLAVDAAVGFTEEPGWSHRYRRSLFATTGDAVDVPSMVIATGPFGDIKNYNGHDFYLSWYPGGLAAEGHALDPPEIATPDSEAIAEATVANLKSHLPRVEEIWAKATSWRLEGGWVFAKGQGSLADPQSSLHRRDRIGVTRAGTYFSVDTGKYSMAPWIASGIADAIAMS